MKTTLIYSSRLIFLLCLTLLQACGEDPVPTDEDFIIQDWTLQSITFNGQSQNVSQFSLKFKSDNKFTFTVPGIPNLPSNGDWSYSKDPTKEITLSGGIKMKVTDLRETRMVLEHTYKNHKEGDVNVVFTFIKT